jgi:peptide-methionine (S)-S-oxide reductase
VGVAPVVRQVETRALEQQSGSTADDALRHPLAIRIGDFAGDFRDFERPLDDRAIGQAKLVSGHDLGTWKRQQPLKLATVGRPFNGGWGLWAGAEGHDQGVRDLDRPIKISDPLIGARTGTVACTYSVRRVQDHLPSSLTDTVTETEPTLPQTRLATFGAGCFWGVEQILSRQPGVLDTAVGYMGGRVDHPTYELVCTETTDHAEVVQVTYDPSVISYASLIDVFWHLHDPTQVDRQGPDVGRQYRSAVFTHDEEQATVARATRDAINASGKLRRPIATEIIPATTFWRGENYHQRYFDRRGVDGCHLYPAW